jgi:hypothetical protein
MQQNDGEGPNASAAGRLRPNGQIAQVRISTRFAVGRYLKWVDVFRQFSQGIQVYTCANNHYAGNGPQTTNLFWKLLTQSKL